MIKEAMEYITNLGHLAAAPGTITVNDRTFLHGVTKELLPQDAATMRVSALDAVVEWVKSGKDFAGELTVHVESPTTVTVSGPLDLVYGTRRVYLQAVAPKRGAFQFNQFISQEEFVIRAQVHFVPTAEMVEMLKVVGTLREERALTLDDDGVSQTVVASTGMKLGRVELPNPVPLRPFRTFAELDQPSSQYIVRARGGGESALPQLGLFEVDDGAWWLEAVEAIAYNLREALSGVERVTLLA